MGDPGGGIAPAAIDQPFVTDRLAAQDSPRNEAGQFGMSVNDALELLGAADQDLALDDAPGCRNGRDRDTAGSLRPGSAARRSGGARRRRSYICTGFPSARRGFRGEGLSGCGTDAADPPSQPCAGWFEQRCEARFQARRGERVANGHSWRRRRASTRLHLFLPHNECVTGWSGARLGLFMRGRSPVPSLAFEGPQP